MYLLMLLLWIIFNGRITLEVVLIGMVICAAIYVFACKIMGASIEKDLRMTKLFPAFMKYEIVLVLEIIKANLEVIKIILSPHMAYEPKVVRFHSNLQENNQTILANSITLTPGTITAGLNNGDFIVCALDTEFTKDLEHSVFVKQLEKMEEK